MKKFCIVTVLVFWSLLFSGVSFGQKLYLFSQGDIHDPDVGGYAQTATTYFVLPIIYSMPNNSVFWYNHLSSDDNGDISPGNWTGPDIELSYNVKDDILEAIRRCPAGPNDTILFYWCGHGAFDEDGHFLWMPENRGELAMRRAEILSALKEKNARLTILITESCHVLQSFPDMPPQAPNAPSTNRFSPLFQNLFFNYSGVIDVNSSSPGQSSAATEDTGGLFTGLLVHFFYENIDESRGWKEAFDYIDRTLEREGGYNQTVYIWSLPEGNGRNSETRANDWSNSVYHPENGDRIIAVNDIEIYSEADFRRAVRESDTKILLTLIDHRTQNRYYMITQLRSPSAVTRLGIYVKEDGGEGVVVTSVLRGSPATRCKYLKNGDVHPVYKSVDW